MTAKPYHHGNLKNEFIEKGLEYIDRFGVESLSMRKLAEEIGVSSAAPYAHFKNKDAFLEAVRDYINEKLITALREALEKCRDRKKILLDLGKSYVLFFYGNPLYYQFLFTRGSIDINTNEPFLFFSGVASQALGVMHDDKLSKKTLRKKTIALWAMVHGLAQIAMMDGALDESRLDAEIVSILCSVEV